MTVPLIDLSIQHAAIANDLDRDFRQIIETTAFINGSHVAAFEQDFAAYIGTRHAIGVANGTDALHLTLRALGIGAGDEVITAANTFIATTEAISAAGATMVLVDIDAETYTLDPALVRQAITPRTRAIMPVHLYGQPANMEAIMEIANEHGLLVVEDASQAHGARFNGQRLGSIGIAGCFSCYPGKNLGAYGDAGVVTTNDDEVARRLRLLISHGSLIKYQHEIEGWNSRLDTLQAAVLKLKLPLLDGWNADRQRIAEAYTRKLSGSGIQTPVQGNGDHVWHLYVIETDERDDLGAALREQGIASAIHYPQPLHLTPAYAHLGMGPGTFPLTERAASRILSLPMYPGMTDEQIDEVVGAVWAAIRTTVAA